MHRLTTSFILGFHGCDRTTGEWVLQGEDFRPSNNDYDWLGPGIYFWESSPQRGLDFAREAAKRKPGGITEPFVIGAVIDLGLCLDLSTAEGIKWLKWAYDSLVTISIADAAPLATNSPNGLRRNLDCAVIRRLHGFIEESGLPPVDTVKGVFTEGKPVYPGAGFDEKTHIQIAVRNPLCIKGVFRVSPGRFKR